MFLGLKNLRKTT